jgi:hypothetical protein
MYLTNQKALLSCVATMTVGVSSWLRRIDLLLSQERGWD